MIGPWTSRFTKLVERFVMSCGPGWEWARTASSEAWPAQAGVHLGKCERRADLHVLRVGTRSQDDARDGACCNHPNDEWFVVRLALPWQPRDADVAS
jgi:hypothetical protein